MSRHTPAPWTATLWGNEEFSGWQFTAGGSLLPLDDATGDPEEAEANATLIAFAPEMLQALETVQEMLSTVCGYYPGDEDKIRKARQVVDSVIDKVAGNA